MLNEVRAAAESAALNQELVSEAFRLVNQGESIPPPSKREERSNRFSRYAAAKHSKHVALLSSLALSLIACAYLVSEMGLFETAGGGGGSSSSSKLFIYCFSSPEIDHALSYPPAVEAPATAALKRRAFARVT